MTKPYPFQLEVVEEIATFGGRCLVALDMGTGKTFISLLHALRNEKMRPVVIVCPASLKENWKREAAKHVGMHATVLSGTKPNVDPKNLVSPILIINYDILKKWWETLASLKPQLVICDEGHYLQGRTSQRTKAVRLLCHGVPSILVLTGTPLTNRPADLWPILNLICPRLYPSFWNYAREFCNLRRTPWGFDWSGASNLGKLHKTLLGNCMIRRKKADVLKQLPPMQRIVMPIEITDRRQYDTAKKDFMSWMLKYSPTTLKTAQKAEGLVKIGYLLRLTATLKLPVIREWIDNFLAGSDEKLTVYGIHRKIVESLHETYNKESVLIHGGIVGKNRQRAVDQFQRDKKTRLFIGNVKAAGVGLTLTAAATVANIEFGWVPGDHIQAEGRCILENTLVSYLPSGKIGNMSLTQIENIRAGDRVLSHTGQYRTVLATAKRLHQSFITDIAYVGWDDPLRCTHDHKIFVKRDEKLQWIEAHKLLPSDSMVFPKETQFEHLAHVKIQDEWRMYKTVEKPETCQHPSGCSKKITARGLCNLHYRKLVASPNCPPKPPQINPRHIRLPDIIPMTDEWLFLLGWYVAEGFAGFKTEKGSGFVSFSGHVNERPILERIKKTIEETTGVKSFISHRVGTNGIEMRSYSIELARWFRSWFGHGAKHKSLPPEILRLPPAQALPFLKGYISGDGYERNQQTEWTSASQQLCWQICQMAIKVGYIPTMRYVQNQGDGAWVGGFTRMSNPSNKRLNDQDDLYIYRPIRSVTTHKNEKRQWVYDLTVDIDHSFTCGMATVHNCHRIGQTKDCTSYWLVGRDTIEEKLVKVLQTKQQNISAVVDGDEEVNQLDVYNLLIDELRKENNGTRRTKSKSV